MEPNDKQKRFFIPINYPYSYAQKDADAILFPWTVRDNIVFTNPYKNLEKLHTIGKVKGPNWHNKMATEQHNVYTTTLRKLLDRFKKSNNIEKPIIILLETDSEQPFWLSKEHYFFRCSLCKSTQLKNEFILPTLLEDIDEEFHPTEKKERPTVGFCGFPQHYYRTKLLKALHHHNSIEDNFIYRSKYFWQLAKALPPEKGKQLKEEYFDNIRLNDFVVCSRGAGNYSFRFYETLRSGRIPILIDSDMPFPFEDEIEWENLVICKKTPEEIIATMLEWCKHKDIAAIQRNCRRVWENYLSRTAYMKNISILLGQRLSN
jgi:hypothetical protein